jgi:hypothetical protein
MLNVTNTMNFLFFMIFLPFRRFNSLIHPVLQSLGKGGYASIPLLQQFLLLALDA